MADNIKDLIHVLFEGTPQERAMYAAEKHGQKEAMASALKDWEGRDAYRRPDISVVVDNVLNGKYSSKIDEPEIIDAEFRDESRESLDDKLVPYDAKPNIAKVALKGTVNLINKTRWYYPILGALPGKWQEKIAKRRGEDAISYTTVNSVFEGLAIPTASAIVSYLLNANPINILGTVCVAGLVSVFYTALRKEDNCPKGSPLITLSYYTALGTVLGIAAAGKAIKNAYSLAYQQEQKLLESKVIDAKFEESD